MSKARADGQRAYRVQCAMGGGIEEKRADQTTLRLCRGGGGVELRSRGRGEGGLLSARAVGKTNTFPAPESPTVAAQCSAAWLGGRCSSGHGFSQGGIDTSQSQGFIAKKLTTFRGF